MTEAHDGSERGPAPACPVGMDAMEAGEAVPVVLFAYARPEHLRCTLAALRANGVRQLHVYCDGPREADRREDVEAVRRIVRAIDWCQVQCVERAVNFGLGRSIREGVSEVLAKHPCCIVVEDDLILRPGAYAWMCAALRRYWSDARVMSITAWTHPRVTPSDVGSLPYFDGRAECWVWGTWARAWAGMQDADALGKLEAARLRGIEPDAYGSDLPAQAQVERTRNIWAVRWLYHHLARGGLCLRPPWSMVEHIGFDASAANASGAMEWANPPLRAAPPLPETWPEPVEHPCVAALWRAATTSPRRRRRMQSWAKRIVPAGVRARLRACWGWRWFRGVYPDWESASRAATGYATDVIVDKVLSATVEVLAGRAAYERDGVLFQEPAPDWRLLNALMKVGEAQGSLRVLDFGGSLGSTYWRHRSWLQCLPGLSWHIVEQPGFVEAGRRHLAATPLRFFCSVAEACRQYEYDLVLASGVVQYLADPDSTISEWVNRGFAWLLFNNLPLHDRADQITVQHVPPSIYAASYPVRFFNREDFLRRFAGKYAVHTEYPSEAVWPVGWRRLKSTGLVLKRVT